MRILHLADNRLPGRDRFRIAATVLKFRGGMKRLLPAALLAVLICALSLFSATAPGPLPAAAQDRWLDLPAPTGVAVVNGDDPGEAIISWHPVTGAAFYRIAWIAAQDTAAIAESGDDWLGAIAFTDVIAADADLQHTVTRLNPGVRYIFQVGSLRVPAGTPSWSSPAELNLALGTLMPDESIDITIPVGLTANEPGAYGGYTLIVPGRGNGLPYLIDSGGQMVHQWEHALRQVRLLENGNVLASNRGQIYEIDPLGNVLWSYRHPQRQHHDLLKLPNGNVLLLVREIKTAEEAVAAGANPAFVPPGGLHIDGIVEVRPIYPDSAEIVWKWSIWDHLVQDYDPSKANFGIVAEHPELVDINYSLRYMSRTARGNNLHWMHGNGLDYNPELDQILISVRNLSEIWVIDHSTNAEEVAGHTGGNSGRGGDLLYRWGNPQAYRAGTFADQQLFWQHNPHWIPEGSPGAGNILIFNNGNEYEGRFLDHSSIVEIIPPVSGYGYARREGGGGRYGPAQPVWTYTAENPADFFAQLGSNAHRLPNGNTMIISSRQGVIFEVTPAGATVWRYVNPVVESGPIYQGDPITVEIIPAQPPFLTWGNGISRSYRYALDYPGLQHYDLTPKGAVELYRDGAK